jgi:hypothetical protein
MAIKAQLKPRKKITARLVGVAYSSQVRLQSKSVVPTSSTQSVKPDLGFDALSFVTVMGVKMQPKTVVPTMERQTVGADYGYTGLEYVTVEGMPPAEEVAFSSEQISQETFYGIGYNWFAQVVDYVQKFVNKSVDMTPADILYWLGRVKFIPQGFADSSLSMDFGGGASGWLPDVPRGNATSTLSIAFDSSAAGE